MLTTSSIGPFFQSATSRRNWNSCALRKSHGSYSYDMASGTRWSESRRSLIEPSPPMVIILSIASAVRSLESLARPSRCAIHTLSFFSAMTKCMYSASSLDAASICRIGSERCTMNDLLRRTMSFTQGSLRRLSPMAISVVVSQPASKSSMWSSAESSTMSRWLLMKV